MQIIKRIDWRTVTELIAAVSIVTSLIFVGIELRENSAIARSNAYSVYAVSVSESQSALAAEPILLPIMRRAFTGELPSEFDEDEYFRAYLEFQSIVRLHEGLFRSVQEGILEENQLFLLSATDSFDNPFFRSIWPGRIRNSYTNDFVEHFETLAWNSAE